jgi:hypothetical protein
VILIEFRGKFLDFINTLILVGYIVNASRTKLTALAELGCSIVDRLIDGKSTPCDEDATITCRGTVLGTLIIALKRFELWPVPPKVSSIKMSVNEYSDWLDSNVTVNVRTMSKSHENCPAASEYTTGTEKELLDLPDLPAAFVHHFAQFAPNPSGSIAPGTSTFFPYYLQHMRLQQLLVPITPRKRRCSYKSKRTP